MSERQSYITPAVQAKPELAAIALRRIAQMLDLADDRKETILFASLGPDVTLTDTAQAWCQVALIIADTGDVPSAKIRMQANALSVGATDALF